MGSGSPGGLNNAANQDTLLQFAAAVLTDQVGGEALGCFLRTECGHLVFGNGFIADGALGSQSGLALLDDGFGGTVAGLGERFKEEGMDRRGFHGEEGRFLGVVTGLEASVQVGF